MFTNLFFQSLNQSKYAVANGIKKINASNRSKNPPWPGNNVPESLME